MIVVPPPGALRDWRHGRGLSARAAGALVHVTARTWLRWESGDAAMPPMAWDLAQRRVAPKPNPAGVGRCGVRGRCPPRLPGVCRLLKN